MGSEFSLQENNTKRIAIIVKNFLNCFMFFI
jgi:hypothetical protein